MGMSYINQFIFLLQFVLHFNDKTVYTEYKDYDISVKPWLTFR